MHFAWRPAPVAEPRAIVTVASLSTRDSHKDTGPLLTYLTRPIFADMPVAQNYRVIGAIPRPAADQPVGVT